MALAKNENGVLFERRVTKAKRMKQIPPIIDSDVLVIRFFSFMYVLIIN